jgi:membrane protease YdiL (CAAX protease family)
MMTTFKQETTTAERPLDWPLILFFGLAYAIAWGAFGLIGLIARQSGVDSAQTLLAMGEAFQFEGVTLSVPQWFLYLLTRLADFAFSIAGVVMIAVTAGRIGLRQLWQRLTSWRIRWYWYGLGLLPIGLYVVATAVAGAFPSVTITTGTITTALFSLHAGFFISLFLRGAVGEELGLRGFALPRLQERMSSFRASLIIGVLWGAWHLPVLIGRDPLSIVAFALLSLGLSMLFTLLFNGSGGSLIPVLLFHASQNWEDGFEVLFPSLVGTEWELVSTLSLLVIGLVAGIVVWRNGRFPPSPCPL